VSPGCWVVVRLHGPAIIRPAVRDATFALDR
jgi:hypothetical protein